MLITAFLTTNYSNIMDVYGGGGKLFGGTYLVLFYLGMLFSKHRVFERISIKKCAGILIAFSVLWFSWWRFICINQFRIDAALPFGSGFNPPSISLMTSAILMLCLCYGLFNILQVNKYTNYVVICINWIGKHTLYIFLYHRLFLDFFIKYSVIDTMVLKRIVYMGCMFFGSILIEIILKKSRCILVAIH